jgi:hypothetical protein
VRRRTEGRRGDVVRAAPALAAARARARAEGVEAGGVARGAAAAVARVRARGGLAAARDARLARGHPAARGAVRALAQQAQAVGVVEAVAQRGLGLDGGVDGAGDDAERVEGKGLPRAPGPGGAAGDEGVLGADEARERGAVVPAVALRPDREPPVAGRVLGEVGVEDLQGVPEGAGGVGGRVRRRRVGVAGEGADEGGGGLGDAGPTGEVGLDEAVEVVGEEVQGAVDEAVVAEAGLDWLVDEAWGGQGGFRGAAGESISETPTRFL